MKPTTTVDVEPAASAAPFSGFEARELPTSQGTVHAMVGGSGPPLLLLHGYPQTHLMWHAAAPLLADRHTVIASDLTGYGASSRPAPSLDHAPHRKRAMARDQVEAMGAL
ncbi:MAG: alpha/beta fold hydrolase, partial [Pseudonocardiales bacterium]